MFRTRVGAPLIRTASFWVFVKKPPTNASRTMTRDLMTKETCPRSAVSISPCTSPVTQIVITSGMHGSCCSSNLDRSPAATSSAQRPPSVLCFERTRDVSESISRWFLQHSKTLYPSVPSS